MLDIARGLAGIPFVVNSACRCKAHNRAVGGIRNSAHRSGLACDIRCLNSKDRYKIIFALKTAGFTRILIYKTFIHVDIDPSKPQEILTLK